MSTSSICFVIPYFGRWPFWMPFYLRSCALNPDIDWVFYTDCGIPEGAPGNVRFVETSFTDYCALVAGRLGIDFQPGSPYKLCDIKPALGYIHEQDLANYAFWGFSDIDLVYGDLRAYFSVERLVRFDLLSTHERRVSGHLCLLRNSVRMREAFMQVDGWQKKLSSADHNAFDEGAFSRLFIRRKSWPVLFRRLFDVFNPWRSSSEFVEAYTTPNGRIAWLDGSFDFPVCWLWRQGQLSNDRDGQKQFPYFHFIGWKNDAWPAHAVGELAGDVTLAKRDAWCITPQGFREVKS